MSAERVIETQHGWTWGPVDIQLTSRFKGYYVLTVNGLDIYVSPAGKSVRVFRPGVGELTTGSSQVKTNTPKARRGVSAGHAAGPKRGV